MGKILMIAGLFLLAAGALIHFSDRLPFGRLPGDFSIERKNFSIHFPLATSIILSILLSLVVFLWNKFRN